jgi:hypothetical protein
LVALGLEEAGIGAAWSQWHVAVGAGRLFRWRCITPIGGSTGTCQIFDHTCAYLCPALVEFRLNLTQGRFRVLLPPCNHPGQDVGGDLILGLFTKNWSHGVPPSWYDERSNACYHHMRNFPLHPH